MIPYIVVLILGALFATLSGRALRRMGVVSALLIGIVAVAIPSALAGARDISIGTDTAGYISRMWTTATATSDPIGALNEASFFDNSPLYTFLLILVSMVTDDIHWFLFLASFLQLAPALLAILCVTDGQGCGMAYAYFLIMHFCEALNMNRQGMAMGFVLLSLALFLRGGKWSWMIAFGIAYALHDTAVIAAPLFFLSWVMGPQSNAKHISIREAGDIKVRDLLVNLLMVIAPIVVLFSFFPMMSSLIDSGVVDEGYSHYLTDVGGGSRIRMLFYAAELILILLSNNNVPRKRVFSISGLYALLLRALSFSSRFLWRIAAYYALPSTLYLAYLPSSSCDDAENKPLLSPLVARWLFLALAIAVWYAEIVVRGRHEVYPYTSAVLGI